MAVLDLLRSRRPRVRAELAEIRAELDEAKKKTAATVPDTPPGAGTPRRGYEYGASLLASSPTAQLAQSAERLQILNQLHQAYLTCPWVSAPIDLIARTVTAGGLQVVWEPADRTKKAQDVPSDPPEVARLKRLLRFTNAREDMVQLLRQSVIDLKLFGDAYIEVVTIAGEPVALYTLDATTMTVITDPHGEVLGYKQQTDAGLSADFDPDDIIHISLDAPRGGVYGVSPAQKALLPITGWLFTEATIKENFRRGDPPRLHVDLGSSGDHEVQEWREKYTVYNLGPKSIGNPVVTTGRGTVTVLDPRKVTDYLAATKQLRDDILSTIGVPPAKIGIIEAGNLGGGTGESQDKTFRVNMIIPVQALVLEKLNYHLLQRGFGVFDWRLEFGEIDYRDSQIVENIRDMRLRNGSYTLNRYRDEIGEPPVPGGDSAVLVDRQNLVQWSDMDAMSKAGIALKLKGTALEPGEPQFGQPLDVEKPEQVPVTPPDVYPPGTGPDAQLDPDDRPGGPNDAVQGTPPRERGGGHVRVLGPAAAAEYRRRLAMAMRHLPPGEQDIAHDQDRAAHSR